VEHQLIAAKRRKLNSELTQKVEQQPSTTNPHSETAILAFPIFHSETGPKAFLRD
jgi:hypothetical protein